MDFMQIFYAMVGSFFGFGFALLADEIITRAVKNKSIDRAKENINEELAAILDLLYDREIDDMNAGMVFFDTPIWNSVISTGDILLIHKKYPDYYKDVQKIYWELKCIEKIQSMITVQKVVDEDSMIDILEQTKKGVVDVIKDKWDINSIN